MELEKNLILNKYFLNLFGFDDFNKLGKELNKKAMIQVEEVIL